MIVCLNKTNWCAGSSEEDQEGSGGETELPEIDAHGVDQELKHHLLKKYSGYLSSLKQELSKKKKKGKLPKDARQQLLNWWEMHYKWPYPSVRGFYSNVLYLIRANRAYKWVVCCLFAQGHLKKMKLQIKNLKWNKMEISVGFLKLTTKDCRTSLRF